MMMDLRYQGNTKRYRHHLPSAATMRQRTPASHEYDENVDDDDEDEGDDDHHHRRRHGRRRSH